MDADTTYLISRGMDKEAVWHMTPVRRETLAAQLRRGDAAAQAGALVRIIVVVTVLSFVAVTAYAMRFYGAYPGNTPALGSFETQCCTISAVD